MQQKFFGFVVLLIMLLGTATFALAHGNSFSYEETKDGYKIDIGHDEFIAAGESIRFDYAVYPEDIESVEGEVYTDVWVTITKDRKIYFAGGIHKPVFGATGFTFVFPEEGEYVMGARFQNEGETVVSTEFPLSVTPPLEKKQEIPALLLMGIVASAGLLIGLGVGFFIPRKNKQNV